MKRGAFVLAFLASCVRAEVAVPFQWAPDVPIAKFSRQPPEEVFRWVRQRMAEVAGPLDEFTPSVERAAAMVKVAEAFSGNTRFAFQVPCVKKYDADSQRFNVTLYGMPVTGRTSGGVNPQTMNLRILLMQRNVISKDTYTGTNAFGVTTEVLREVADEFAIGFPLQFDGYPQGVAQQTTWPQHIPYRLQSVALTQRVDMPGGLARQVHKELACLVVARLTEPWLSTVDEREMPTRDQPYDRTTKMHVIHAHWERWIVFNRATGERYAEAKAGNVQ